MMPPNQFPLAPYARANWHRWQVGHKHAILYEFTSLAMRNVYFTKHEDKCPDMIAWGDKMVAPLTPAPGSSNLAVRVWPGVK